MNPIVKGAPGDYRLAEGILSQLEDFMKALHVHTIYIVAGEKAWHATRSYFPDSIVKNAHTNFTLIDGVCTLEKVEEISEQLSLCAADAVLGIGGGTVLDITKAAAVQANVKSILVPTIAATCAAWTPLSVFYDENGRFTHFTEFPLANTLVLIEPSIIANAPLKYLRAGIGDTLAKYYEADALIASFYENKAHPVWLQVSQFSAKICQDVLLENGAAAMEAAANGEVNAQLVSVIETIIMTGGMVGGFGGKFGRTAGAHSLHNGLTEAEEVKEILHGELVAYGVLVQLALEQKDDEILKLMNHYRAWGLPISLENLTIDPNDDALLRKVVQKAILPIESIHLMKQEITEKTVVSAMEKIELLYSTNFERRGELI